MNFVDLRSDLGGARLALESLGHNCLTSTSWQDFLSNTSWSLQEQNGGADACDLLSIQSPAYDSANGYWAPNGDWISLRNVPSVVHSLTDNLNPRFVILTGRQGILSERNGASFCQVLLTLTIAGYEAAWVRLNLSSIGIPQDAIRVGIIAAKSNRLSIADKKSEKLFSGLISSFSKEADPRVGFGPARSLEKLLAEREPRIGLPAPKDRSPFGSCGMAWDGQFKVGSLPEFTTVSAKPSLANIVGLPERFESIPVWSARFVSRNGVKGLQRKKNGLAHSVGPSISAWPLFAMAATDATKLRTFSSSYNWLGLAGDYEVLRIEPSRALLLFGSQAKKLVCALNGKEMSSSSQYKTVAATAAPNLIGRLARALQSFEVAPINGDRGRS